MGWKPDTMNIIHGIEPFIRVQRAENEDEHRDIHALWFQTLG